LITTGLLITATRSGDRRTLCFANIHLYSP